MISTEVKCCSKLKKKLSVWMQRKRNKNIVGKSRADDSESGAPWCHKNKHSSIPCIQGKEAWIVGSTWKQRAGSSPTALYIDHDQQHPSARSTTTKHSSRGNSRTKLEKSSRQSSRQSSSSSSSSSSSLLYYLTGDLQLEIMPFLWDDRKTIEAFLAAVQHYHQRQQFDRAHLKHILSNTILLSSSVAAAASSSNNNRQTGGNQETIPCRICNLPTCYPYQLADCKHQVCGRCAWNRRQEMGACGCGVKIRARPCRLNPNKADCRAHWILDDAENKKRFERNELRVHKGVDGVFGNDGVPNSIDPFDRVSFEAEYDYLPSCSISDELPAYQIPNDCGHLFIILCPAHENYKPYPIEVFAADGLEQIWPNLVDRRWFRSICKKDLVTLEEEDLVVGRCQSVDGDDTEEGETPRGAGRNRFETRLVGWEHMACDLASYDF